MSNVKAFIRDKNIDIECQAFSEALMDPNTTVFVGSEVAQPIMKEENVVAGLRWGTDYRRYEMHWSEVLGVTRLVNCTRFYLGGGVWRYLSYTTNK